MKIVDGTVMITISAALYRELLERDNWLCALEAAGVDNWDGYEEAMKIAEELQNEHYTEENN